MSKNKIERPYNLNKADWNVIVTRFKGNHKNWKLAHFDEFKNRVKEYLRIHQDNRCCYCKKILKYDKKEVEIEHIIPKAQRPLFTFLNYNLALSCPACNTTKHEDLPLIDSGRRTFPHKSSDYLIIHPHFDYYFREIEIINEIFIKSKGVKGDWTIKSCGLDTLEKAKDKILDLKMETKDIQALLLQLTLGIANPQFLPLALELIDHIKSRRFIID